MLFFTSDYHFNHANIIKYCHRPFSSVEEMNETIIHRHNERVKDTDTVIDVGDFIFKNSPGGKAGEGKPETAMTFLLKLKGRRVNIRGNHDRNNSLNTPIEKLYLLHGGKNICVVHNPTQADHKCELNICGHVHNDWKVKRLNDKSIIINVGVDVWNFRPVTFDEIMKRVGEFKRNEQQKST